MLIKDSHLNKTAYILGSGSSLRLLNKKLDSIVFSVNASILKYPDCDYFVSDDADIMKYSYFENIQKSDCVKFLYKKKFMPFLHKINTNYINLYEHKEYIINNKVILDNLKLTKEEPIIGAATSVASCIHIAYIMGFSKIILLGIDNCFYDNKKYFYQFENQPKCYRLDNLENYHKTNDTYQLFNNYWEDFCNVNKDLLQKLEIINGSGEYSQLNVFKKENHLD